MNEKWSAYLKGLLVAMVSGVFTGGLMYTQDKHIDWIAMAGAGFVAGLTYLTKSPLPWDGRLGREDDPAIAKLMQPRKPLQSLRDSLDKPATRDSSGS